MSRTHVFIVQERIELEDGTVATQMTAHITFIGSVRGVTDLWAKNNDAEIDDRRYDRKMSAIATEARDNERQSEDDSLFYLLEDLDTELGPGSVEYQIYKVELQD